MKARRRRVWVFLLTVAAVAVAAWLWSYVLVPETTVLVISVVARETGDPLSGAAVWARPGNGQPLPAATSDGSGLVRYEGVRPDPAYAVRVQKLDYELALVSGVAVAEDQETRLAVRLVRRAGRRLFAGLDQARVTEIDTASLLAVQVVQLPAADAGPVTHLLAHPELDLLYAFTEAEGYILDGRSLALQTRLEMSRPLGETLGPFIEAVGLSEDGQSLFVADGVGAGWLMILDARRGRLQADTYMSQGGEYPLLAVARSGSPSLYVFERDGAARSAAGLGSVVQEVLAGRSLRIWPYAALSADGRYLYFWQQGYYGEAETLRDRLTILPLGEGALVYRQTLPLGTSALATLPGGGELYVLNRPLGTLTVLDPAGQQQRGVVPVGREPEALAISPDGTWAYVANRESQSISAVHLPSASVVHTIPLPGEPRSLAYGR